MARPMLESWGRDIFGRKIWGPASYLMLDEGGRSELKWRLELRHLDRGCWSLRVWDRVSDRWTLGYPDHITDYPNERAGKEALRRAIIVKLLTAG